jgi:ADP-heptose:LPS heptosyltransferase
LILNIEYLICLNFTNRQKKGVVLIRLDAIGDFILWLDSAKEYRQIYPNQTIILLANAAWADLARYLPYWDEVWSVNSGDFRSSLLYRWAMLRKIRRANFEIAIQPTYSRAVFYGDSMIRASNAIHRIGSVGDSTNMPLSDKAIGDKWYTRLISANPKPLMELLRNAEFITNLTKKRFNAEIPILSSSGPLSRGLQVEGPYVVLFPGASWEGRRWPVQSFAKVAEYLSLKYSLNIVLCGSGSDRILCQEINDLVTVGCLNIAGKTNLLELAEIIRNAELLIANETSAIHIAAAVSTPALCILGGGHYGRFLPYPEPIIGIKPTPLMNKMDCYECNWQCSRGYGGFGPTPCIESIDIDVVLKSAISILEN